MIKINKSLEILRVIDKQNLSSIAKLANSSSLQGLFTTSKYPRRRIIDTIELMSRQGYVSIGKLDDDTIVKSTQKGKSKLKYYLLSSEVSTISGTWNQKWYLVTFEIPDKHKVARNKLIITLKEFGLVNYSKGIWLSPYDIRKPVKNLASQLGVAQFINFIVASHIDRQSKFKRKFNI